MLGLMQNWPLTVDRIIDHAAKVHGSNVVVSRHVDGAIVRRSYADIRDRSRRVSSWLLSMGIQPGDRVATLAWNSDRHMESWYGAMGIGAVLHTLNPRLHPDQIAWIANDAGGRVLFLDTSFIGIIEAIKDKLPYDHYVLFEHGDAMPGNASGMLSYEALVAGSDADVAWGGFDENAACGLCYTSGTTGNPKGVLYSHRSNVLHAMMSLSKDAIGAASADVVMPLVPMFHANAWGLAFACPAAGAKMVMPGAKLDGASVYELLDSERVTVTAAVPTVWLGLLQHLRTEGLSLPYLSKIINGGAALPEAVLRAFEDDYGVEVLHAWGMTETSPIGTIGFTPASLANASKEDLAAHKLKQGIPPFGVEIEVVDDDGAPLPHDGIAAGHLLVRGLAVAASYFGGQPGDILDENGFFDTGDVATIDSSSTMKITDRAKDVIKSGGEWISSIDLENLALLHPAVANAAAIGVPHPKWDERPVLIIERRAGEQVDEAAMRSFLDGRIAKWWMPDAIVFVDSVPLGATGKINKLLLRDTYREILNE